ncbi:MAG: galactose-1-phosphate uridylyltransferase [Pirellulaceae bacterium]
MGTRTLTGMRSELRSDPITGRTVIIARDRSKRPHDFARATTLRSHASCPFCQGHESETPEPLAVYGDDGGGDWLVRVIPNKYPALSLDVGRRVRADEVEEGATERTVAGRGYGAHEVIVESPRHVTCFSQLDDAEALLTLRAYRDRLLAHGDNDSLRYAQIFKNTGAAGGASVGHVHSQLIATPFVPPEVAAELAGCRDHFQQHARCAFCDLLRRELGAAERVVASAEHFVALCPFAARFPFETWVIPRRHQANYAALTDAELAELGPLLRSLVAATIGASGQDAYNFLLHTAPFDTSCADHYHWHIELFPRMLEIAGFEWGTGCFINPMPPEPASQSLRSLMQSFRARKTS